MNTKVTHIANPSEKLLQFVRQLRDDKEEKLRVVKSNKAAKNK